MIDIARILLALLTLIPPQALVPLDDPRFKAPDAPLTAALSTLFTPAAVGNATFGASVVDAHSGLPLFAAKATEPVRPASNLKLYTGAAALTALGADYRFKTEVYATAAPVAGVVNGDLYLKGYGDPTLTESDLVRLADQLKAAGITRVTGRLIGDATFFDAVRFHPDWKPWWYSQIFAPEIAGLSIAPDEEFWVGNVGVRYTPGAVGKPATLEVLPAAAASYLTVVNKTTTTAAGGGDGVWLGRTSATDRTITVSGKISADRPVATRYIPVADPTRFALTAFKTVLERSGIGVGALAVGPVPAGAVLTASDTSAPLSEVEFMMLKLSNNGIAEHLVKTLGRERGGAGTWAAGVQVVRDTLAKAAELDTSAFVLRDGSGLSEDNRVTAYATTKLLVWARTQPWFAAFFNGLPVAGNPERHVGGSLRERMKGTLAANHVWAKTGSLKSTHSLSGYAEGADGRLYAFSMLATNVGYGEIKREEQLCVLLAGWRRA